MKRIVSLIITISLIFSFSASAYADSMASAQGLTDIKDHWAEKEIKDLYDKKIITGNTKGEYEPRREITRGEFVTLLVKVMGYNLTDGSTFKDMGYDKYWAKKSIETLVTEGVIIPYEWGENFWGTAPITREQMTIMMARALKLEPSANKNPFFDMSEPDGLLVKAYEEFLIKGIDKDGKTLFSPFGLTTKAEAATIIARVLEYKQNPSAYKAKMEAEKKANEIIEPEFFVDYKYANTAAVIVAEIFITNYKEYDSNYSFKVECINYPQVNKSWIDDMGVPPFLVNFDRWRRYNPKQEDGDIYHLQKRPYYADEEITKSFVIEPNMEIEFKITVKKGNISKEFYLTVNIPSKVMPI